MLRKTSNRSPQMPLTRWDWVDAVKQGGISPEARQALALLCEGYWFPIYARLRSMGCTPEDAEDLTQGFFEKLLRTGAFERAAPEKGRLRNLLLASLNRFFASARRAEGALKRGGPTAVHLPLFSAWAEERMEAEEPHSQAPAPDVAFNQRWWGLVLERATANVQAEYERRGKGALARQLSPLYDENLPVESTLRELAEQTGMSAASLRVALLRLRRRLATEIKAVVRQTTGSDAEAEEELRFFLSGM